MLYFCLVSVSESDAQWKLPCSQVHSDIYVENPTVYLGRGEDMQGTSIAQYFPHAGTF